MHKEKIGARQRATSPEEEILAVIWYVVYFKNSVVRNRYYVHLKTTTPNSKIHLLHKREMCAS